MSLTVHTKRYQASATLTVYPQSKTPSPDCECRLLPAEVTWVNTALARLMYDVTRDPAMIARVQHRIQRKLNTLKVG